MEAQTHGDCEIVAKVECETWCKQYLKNAGRRMMINKGQGGFHHCCGRASRKLGFGLQSFQ